MSIQTPPQPSELNAPPQLLEALAKDYDLDPVEIRFITCATCPGG